MQHNIKKKIIRKYNLADKILIIDGLPGCGKTMFSAILSSFERVELLSYAFEIEFICRLHYLGKVSKDASIAMVNNLIDSKLYNSMMGRDVNFRFSDLSSVFNYPKPLKYFKRIFQSGDETVPEKIKHEKPILNIATHDLIHMSEPLHKALSKRVTYIQIVRHPLFMLIQQFLNFERLLDNPRDIQIHFEYKNYQLPYLAWGWEKLFVESNNIDKTIFFLERQIKLSEEFKSKNNYKIITIPFENFVRNPKDYLAVIEKNLGTLQTSLTKKIMKKQKVPRDNIVDGIPLNIYKRCGWEPPIEGNSEKEEFNKRRDFAINNKCSEKALNILDKISNDYERKYLLTR